MDIYEVTTEYVEYLRRFEPTKILKNNDDKSNRKFVGIIVQNGAEEVMSFNNARKTKCDTYRFLKCRIDYIR